MIYIMHSPPVTPWRRTKHFDITQTVGDSQGLFRGYLPDQLATVAGNDLDHDFAGFLISRELRVTSGFVQKLFDFRNGVLYVVDTLNLERFVLLAFLGNLCWPGNRFSVTCSAWRVA